MKKPYYTALSKEDIVSKYKPLNMVDINGSVAMAWDIELCYLPKEYNKVDVLYTELAWEAGYEKFHNPKCIGYIEAHKNEFYENI